MNLFYAHQGVEPPEWFAEDLPLATIVATDNKELCGRGLLCVTDLAVLERWCVAYEFWRRAVKILPDGATPSPVQWAVWSKSGADRQKNRSPR